MIKKLTLALCLMGLFFTGCKDDEQTEFSVDALAYSATLQGNVVYDVGVDPTKSDYTIIQNTPAVGRKVYVATPLSSYSGGASGDYVVEAIVDSLGAFSVDVPIPYTGATVTVTLEDFTASYTTYLGMSGGEPVFESVMQQYSGSDWEVELKPNQTYVFSEVLKYEQTALDLTQYEASAVIKGGVQLAVEDSYRIGSFVAAANKSIEVEVTINGVNTEDETQDFTFGATTDENGEFELTIPLISRSAGFELTSVKMLESINSFTHYYAADNTMTLTGTYAEKTSGDVSSSTSFTSLTDDEVCDLGTTYLFFAPGTSTSGDYELTGSSDAVSASNSGSYTNELAGWQLVNKSFAGYSQTVTITGNVYLGRETAYGFGEYSTSATTVSLEMNSVNFVAPTDSDGAFSFEVPVEDANKIYAIGSNLSLYRESSSDDYETENEPFVHYSSASETKSTYNGYFKQKTAIATAGEKWNNLGDIYFVYDATATAATSDLVNYNADLVGWSVNTYDYTATVTGSIYKAIETAYGVGEYAPVASEMVKVTVKNGNVSEAYSAITASDGSYSVEVGVLENVVPTVDVSYTPVDVLDFNHYASATAAVSQLEGEYSSSDNIKPSGATWNNCGATYYQFEPTSSAQITDTEWETKFKNIAGWKLNTNKYEYTKTVSAKVMLATETGYATGTYTAAAGRLAKITANSIDYIVPVAADGSVSVTIPVEKENEEFTYELTLVDADEDSFTHYTSSATKQTYGEYANQTAIADSDKSWNDKYTYYYSFTEDGAVSTDKVLTDLAGWVVKQDYNETKTVSGSIMVAKEDSYAVGSYTAAGLGYVEIIIDGTKYQAPVDASTGAYSFSVPVKYATSTYAPGDPDYFLPSGGKVTTFTHYSSASKTETLEGVYEVRDYANSGYSAIVKADDAEWNDMGVAYMYFQDQSSSSTYNKNLAGWVMVEDMTQTQAVSGSLQLPIETAYGVGSYAAPASGIVTVRITYPDGSADFAVPVAADGSFTLNAPVFATNIDYKIASTTYSAEADKYFVHYKAAGETVNLYANATNSYTEDVTVKSKDAKWYDAGTRYYEFSPSATSKNAASAYANYYTTLAGWTSVAVKAAASSTADYDAVETVSGYIKLAAESSYGVGVYQALSDKFVDVKVKLASDAGYDTERTFTVLVGADGKYSVDIPVKEAGAKYATDPTVSASVKDLDKVDYTKYTAIATSEVVTGDYTLLPDNTIRSTDALWNDRGTDYYTNTNAKYSNLIGWYVSNTNTYPAEIKGKVMFAKQKAYMEGYYENAPAGVLMNVQYDGGTTYVVVTNADGEYTSAAYFANEWEATIDKSKISTSQTEAYEVKDFVNYAQYPEQYVTDIVGATPKTTTFLIDGEYNNGSVKTQVSDTYNAGIKHIGFSPDAQDPDYSSATLYSSLVGYQILEDESLWTTVNFSGTLNLGVEKSYLTAEYLPAANTIVRLSYDPDGSGSISATEVYAKVDANGKFSEDLPILKTSIDGSGVDLTAASVLGTGNYTHYTSLTEKSDVSSVWAVKKTIAGEAWNQLGEVYYTNTNANTVNLDQLVGLRIKEATDTEITYKSGKMMIPVQTAFRTGAYTEYKGQYVAEVTDSYGGASDGSQTFLVLTDADGVYSYTQYLPADKVSANANAVTVTTTAPAVPSTGSFTHYINSSDAKFTLAGSYTPNVAIYFDSSDKQVAAQAVGSTSLPTFYYSFTPDYSVLSTEAKAAIDWTEARNNAGYFAGISGWETPLVDAFATNLQVNVDIWNAAVVSSSSKWTAGWAEFTNKNVAVSYTNGAASGKYYVNTGASGKVALSIPLATTAQDVTFEITSIEIEDRTENGFVAYDKAETENNVDPVKYTLSGTWAATATYATGAATTTPKFDYNTSNATFVHNYEGANAAQVLFTPDAASTTLSSAWWSIYDWTTAIIQN